LLRRELERYVSAGTLLEIYRERFSAEPLVGRISQVSAHVFAMERLSDLYESEGICAGRVCDITRIRSATRELGVASQLAPSRPAPLLPEVALLEISSAITMLHKQFGHVSLYCETLDPHICFIGEYEELDDDFVKVRGFGTYQTMDRPELLVRLADVTRVEAGGRYERQLVAQFERGEQA
jgi:hypothetical protein